MAVDILPTVSLLNNLAEALVSATTAFPTDEQSILPPADGISLLDVKNDLLLSYLQNLVFLILLRLRSCRDESDPDNTNLNEEVVRKLIELRVYIDRGVRPLEGRLRYQIDKVLRAAEETERVAAQKTKTRSSKKASKKHPNGTTEHHDSSEASNSNSESENSDIEINDNDEDLKEILHRPNALALAQRMKETTKPQLKSSLRTTASSAETYKPPRITPTAMPLPSSARDRSDAPSRRRKSNLLSEYIDEELSSAPKAQPSIGSNNTILAHGRSGLSTRDREKERERLEYEERNFVRLPGESKADRKKARLRGDNGRRDMFGGEDLTGLGGLGDRVNKSVQQGKGRAGVLERREKRGRDTQDGQRGDGMGIGEMFTKRQKALDDRAERKRRRKG